MFYNIDPCCVSVTAASSQEEREGRTFLHFKLSFQKDTESQSGKVEKVHLDLTPQEFFKVLHEMERAKNNLEALIGSSATN